MLLTKLKIRTAILLVVVALIGTGTAGLAYRTRAAEPAAARPRHAPMKDTAKGDPEVIQGTWRLMKMEVNRRVTKWLEEYVT